MRVIHTADWHLGKNLEGMSRLPEQERFIDFFVEQCAQLKPDLILLAGDVYDTANPPAKAEKLFYDALKRLSRDGECLTLVIAGNHDNPERLVSATPLAMEHGIIMIGTPKTVVEKGMYGNHEVLDSGEGFVELRIHQEKVVVIAVPYPSEKRLNEVFYEENQEEDERMASYGQKIAALFQQLETHFREDTVNLTVSHLFAFGSEAAGSERASSLGGSFLVHTDALPQQAQYTALGHIHKPQILPNTNHIMRYSGSPIHYNITEANTQKSFYVIDVKAGEKAIIEKVDIPTFKPIQLWKCESVEDAIEQCRIHQDESSWVYMEVKTDYPIKEDEIKKMRAYKKDILEIRPLLNRVEETRQIHRMEELSFEEQFKEFYKAQRGVEPESEMVDLLMEIMEEQDDETGSN